MCYPKTIISVTLFSYEANSLLIYLLIYLSKILFPNIFIENVMRKLYHSEQTNHYHQSDTSRGKSSIENISIHTTSFLPEKLIPEILFRETEENKR